MVRYGGRRHDENIDPDKAGGIRFVSEAFSAAPKQKKQLKWDLEKLPPLSPKLKGIEVVLLQDILLRAYKFATSGGRIKLRDLNKLQNIATEQGGIAKLASLLKSDISESARALETLVKGGQGSMTNHLEKLRQFVHSGFASQIAQLQITNTERDLLVYHLVHDTDEGFRRVEEKDPGVTRYMLKMLTEELKALKMFPEELEERFGLSALGGAEA
jgi:hypothetical protein